MISSKIKNVDSLAERRTILANERTLLAFIRTALALLVSGVGLTEFVESTLFVVVGWVLIITAVLFLILGITRYNQHRDCIE